MTMTPNPATTRSTLADPTPLRSAAGAAVTAGWAALGEGARSRVEGRAWR